MALSQVGSFEVSSFHTAPKELSLVCCGTCVGDVTSLHRLIRYPLESPMPKQGPNKA